MFCGNGDCEIWLVAVGFVERVVVVGHKIRGVMVVVIGSNCDKGTWRFFCDTPLNGWVMSAEQVNSIPGMNTANVPRDK